MKQLIISDYDMECSFQFIILTDGKLTNVGEDSIDLKYFDLYDFENCWFSEALINKDNKKIKTFKQIICCVDGTITIYNKGKDY